MGRFSALCLCIPVFGCTVYTECPAPTVNSSGGTDSGVNTDGGSGNVTDGGSGDTTPENPNGTAGTLGEGGAGPTAPEVPEDPWTNVTGRIAELPSGCGNLAYLGTSPHKNLVVISVAGHGLWGSTDGGETWERLGQGEGSDEVTNRGSHFVFDPDDANTFWEVGNYGPGVYRTTDGGETFKALGSLLYAEKLGIDFTDPDRKTLVATTHERPTLFRSQDGGETWQDITASLPEDAGICVPVLVLDSDTHLLGCGGGIYRTSDGAESWEQVSEGLATGAPFIARDGDIYWSQNDASVLKSSDDGQSWEQVSEPGRFRGLLQELPDGRWAALGFEYVVVSDDQGATWLPASGRYPFEPPFGTVLAYSGHQKAFFMSHFDCDSDELIPEDAILRYSFDYED